MNSKEQDAKPVLVPPLRFPGFTGEWEEKKFGELGTFRGGGTPDKAISDYWSGDIPWISSSDIDEDDIRIILPTRFITEKAVKNSATKKIPVRSILFVSRVGVGKLAVSTEELCTSQDFINFRPESDNEYFLAYYFRSKANLLISFGQGMAIKGFTKSDLESITLPLPTLPEQTRIAAALSSLDAVIAAHQSKQDALREHKRGLMAGLFPAEGERVPRLRFPEFEGAGEWEEKKLGELGTFKGGGTPDKAVSEYWTGAIPWISSSDIDEDDIRTVSPTRFITEEAVKNSATKKVPARSVLFVSRVGVGKLAVSTEELCTSQDFINFRPKNDNEYFLAYYFKSKASLLISFGQGMAIKGFTKNDLESITLPLPSLPEQTCIAAALSCLDDLITAQGDKITALQEFKRGLMQGLFPAWPER